MRRCYTKRSLWRLNMADFCTCGAQLPPDALFCHKCGKPQREILEPEVERNVYVAAVPDTALPPPPRPQPLPVNFRNPIAVRISLMAAVSAMVLGLLLPFVSWLAAGFFAAYLYCRKTGFRLNVAAGVKIGWITGLILYGFSAIVFTAAQVPDALAGHPGRTIVGADEELLVSRSGDDAGGDQIGAERSRKDDSSIVGSAFRGGHVSEHGGRSVRRQACGEPEVKGCQSLEYFFTTATPAKITAMASRSRGPKGSR